MTWIMLQDNTLINVDHITRIEAIRENQSDSFIVVRGVLVGGETCLFDCITGTDIDAWNKAREIVIKIAQKLGVS